MHPVTTQFQKIGVSGQKTPPASDEQQGSESCTVSNKSDQRNRESFQYIFEDSGITSEPSDSEKSALNDDHLNVRGQTPSEISHADLPRGDANGQQSAERFKEQEDSHLGDVVTLESHSLTQSKDVTDPELGGAGSGISKRHTIGFADFLIRESLNQSKHLLTLKNAPTQDPPQVISDTVRLFANSETAQDTDVRSSAVMPHAMTVAAVKDDVLPLPRDQAGLLIRSQNSQPIPSAKTGVVSDVILRQPNLESEAQADRNILASDANSGLAGQILNEKERPLDQDPAALKSYVGKRNDHSALRDHAPNLFKNTRTEHLPKMDLGMQKASTGSLLGSISVDNDIKATSNTTNGSVELRKTVPEPATFVPLKHSAPKQLQDLSLVNKIDMQFTPKPDAAVTSFTDHILQMTVDASAATATDHRVSVPRHDLPVHIARQLAEVAQQASTRPVEISLNPEELGRVRLYLASSETGITLNVLAERPETLDLLRRHIDQLAKEFQNLGYQDISFSFSDADSGSTGSQSDPEAENSGPSAKMEADARHPSPTQIHLSAGATSGLDLRL